MPPRTNDDDQDKRETPDEEESSGDALSQSRPGTGPWVYDPTIFYGDGDDGHGPIVWGTPISVRTDVAAE